ncbi:MAG: GTP-binding protein [Candidimonas sp.]|nr:MAG: GTP-binding protein [Candidimonas sp.]
MTAEPAERVPVTIITGYLGTGKTTLLNRLLQDDLFAHSVVVVNEFGEIGLDHLLIATPTENTVVLEGGCMCCKLRGELVDTLADLHADAQAGKIKPFDRVVVETTGLADPVPILQTIVSDPRLSRVYGLDRIVTLIDGQQGGAHLLAHPESAKQVAISDCLVVSKVDLITVGRKRRLIAQLREINPDAVVFTSSNGATDVGRVFAARPLDRREQLDAALQWLNSAAYANGHSTPADGERDHAVPDGRNSAHVHEREHPHADAYPRPRTIDSFSFLVDGEVRADGLRLWIGMLTALKSRNILRLKALLNVEGRPVVIQMVQAVVYEPFTLEHWPDAERRSRIVVIGKGLVRADIEGTFSLLRFGDDSPTGAAGMTAGTIDPASYQRFLKASNLLVRAAGGGRDG